MRNHNWNLSTLEKEEVNERKINEFINFIKKENKPVHGLVIIKNGNLVKI